MRRPNSSSHPLCGGCLTPLKLLVGVPVAFCETTDKHRNCTGDGYIPLDNDPNGNDMRGVISALRETYFLQFGGIMGWDYTLDLQYDFGSWSQGISSELSNYPANWIGIDVQTGLCLDTGNYSPTNGNVYTDGCNYYSVNSQNWQFKVNTIVNAETGLCLEAIMPARSTRIAATEAISRTGSSGATPFAIGRPDYAWTVIMPARPIRRAATEATTRTGDRTPCRIPSRARRRRRLNRGPR